MSEDALLAQLRTLELRLLDPQLRADVQVLDALLDPPFVEFGTSGRRYMRSEVIVALSASGVAADDQADGFECMRLARDLVQCVIGRWIAVKVLSGRPCAARCGTGTLTEGSYSSTEAPRSPRMPHPDRLSLCRFPCLQNPVPHA
ncbi:hypothetical protein XBLMG947_0377 [Xanthomonas bromi]|uniref:DUF4440 domain-containing protein n=1 Tax=Xanthomonas bromi TaxID=56449 RepID=A0A1C3NGS3_9XANT|nr:hypothetical protein XBLMG947_0377 [Xanthomonas bromi]